MRTVYRQFIKFALVGTTNTAIDFLVYTSLTRVIQFWFQHKIEAAVIAFLVATTNSYLLNKYWTFKDTRREHHVQLIKFILVGVVGLGFNVAIFWLLLPLGWNDLLVKAMVIGIVLFWNFTVNKLWTFADN